MSHAIASLCGTVIACSTSPVGLAFAAQHSPSSTSNPPTPTSGNRLRLSIPTPPAARPYSVLDSAASTPTRTPPRFLSRRISSSFSEAWPSSRSSDTSHASRPRFSRRSTSNFSTPSQEDSEKDAPSRSNANSSSSAQPFVAPGLLTPPSAPNKLVKRSSSQRDSHKAPPSSFRLHLKRPATSHQRSASWSMQNIEAARNNDLRPVEAYTHPKPPEKLQNFLQVRNRKIRNTHDSDIVHIKQLRPSNTAPVLVQASDVSPPEVVLVEEVVDVDHQLHKTPQVSASSVRADSIELEAPPSKRSQRDHEIPTRRKTPNSTPQAKLLRRISRRLTSAPALNWRPSAMDASEDSQDQHQRAPSGPFTFGESESDASPPATPTSLPYRLLQRRTRPSATSSDQASSRPGSDGGARVFSWTEGLDDDMNSDTVYDSIRTATTTRSTSGPMQSGLDTMFDQPSAKEGLALQDGASVSHDRPATDTNARAGPRPETRPQTPVQHKHSALPQGPSGPQEEMWDSNDASPGSTENAHFATSATIPGLGVSPRETGVKSSLFDWSEQPSVAGAERDTPPRPKTAHPKKQLEVRGAVLSSTGRRAPSGLHSRSHSVPALQDLAGRQNEPGSKFGSWGVGAKGATESWDNDFEFDDGDFGDGPAQPVDGEISATTSRQVSGSMVVPDNIQKQQSNVLANISLLREWGMLIEELKDMRIRANHIGVRTADNARLFDEVDAMIDLADQEAEDEAFPLGIRSPASSQGFSDEDGFDQVTPPRSEAAQRARLSPSDMLRVMQRNKPTRASPRVDSPEAFQRPRQDSEAMARSVIEALQRWRKPVADDDGDATPQGKTRKVPFDTATLKHIVPHVSNLMHRVKRIVREAEGLNTSPQIGRSIEGLALHQAFRPAAGLEESPGAQKEQRLRVHRRTSQEKTPPLPLRKPTLAAEAAIEGESLTEERDNELEAGVEGMKLS